VAVTAAAGDALRELVRWRLRGHAYERMHETRLGIGAVPNRSLRPSLGSRCKRASTFLTPKRPETVRKQHGEASGAGSEVPFGLSVLFPCGFRPFRC
jgi:hypothetical protein